MFFSHYINITHNHLDGRPHETKVEIARIVQAHDLTMTPAGQVPPATRRLTLILALSLGLGGVACLLIVSSLVFFFGWRCLCACFRARGTRRLDDGPSEIELSNIGGGGAAVASSDARARSDESAFDELRRERRERRNRTSGDSFACGTIRDYDRAMALPLPAARL